MKSISDILSLVVGVISGILAVLFFYWFVTARNSAGRFDTLGVVSTHYLYYAIGATVVAIVALVYYFARHVNKEEEIHITQ